MSIFPHPPEAKNPAEFAQIVFVCVIALVISISAIGVVIVESVDPDTDTNLIVLLIAVIVSALFGFVCGRSSLVDQTEREDR